MSQLKTREQMMSLNVSELETYENELYQLWTQASVIRRYKVELESTRVLLNDTNVIDIPLLLGGEEE
jgi:hypothetical protein